MEDGVYFFLKSEKYFFKKRKVAKNISIILLENMKNILIKISITSRQASFLLLTLEFAL